MVEFQKFFIRHRNLVLTIAFIIISSLICLFFTILLFQATINQLDNISSLKNQVDSLQRKFDILNSLDQTNLEKEFFLTTSSIPIEKSLITIINLVEGIAERSGVNLVSFEVDSSLHYETQSGSQKVNIDKGFGRAYALPFYVHMNGTLDQMKSFLAIANKARRIISPKSFNIVVDQEGLTMQIVFDAFFAPIADVNQQSELKPLKENDYLLLSRLRELEDIGLINLDNFTSSSNSTNSSESQQNFRSNPFSLE
ncbi:MAG: hypothetical protein N3A54_03130 [Patescibacteria group bacterium]|nr:hypothetical protein [Patescibacteria group bacterium]